MCMIWHGNQYKYKIAIALPNAAKILHLDLATFPLMMSLSICCRPKDESLSWPIVECIQLLTRHIAENDLSQFAVHTGNVSANLKS